MLKIFRHSKILKNIISSKPHKVLFNFSRFNNKFDKEEIIINVDNETKMDKLQLQINIPKTNFNERINPKENETKFLNKITQEFYLDQLKEENKKLWITHDGPTLASGKPHLGILYNKVLKDTLNRIKIMQGYKVLFNIGFDCHGISIEDKVMSEKNVFNIKF